MTGEPELDVTGPEPAVPGPPAPGAAGAPEVPAQAAGTAEFAQVDKGGEPYAPAQAGSGGISEGTPAGPAVTKLDVRDSAAGDEAGSGAAAGPEEAVTGFPGIQQNGMLLANRYRLSERIAIGGMGQVWRATDELLGRPVAVKLLSARHAADEHFRTRFRAEAQYAASLSHRGIARVYDYGESGEGPGAAGPPESGVPYLVMELVEGEPLSAAIARDGRMPVDATLDIVAQSARALAAAHAAGIVHRDIKPGNLLLTPEHQVKITDFGIARAAQGTHLTQTGMVMGTAQYVSPEQASARPVTAAADIYSLGVVAYECLAGRPPFTADAPIALALAHVNQPPPPLPGDVPPPVAALVGQMLAKDPQARPGSANEVADRASALRAASQGGQDAWLAMPPELTSPAIWFADPAPAAEGQHGPAAPGGTAITSATAGPPERPRRRLAQVLVAAAVVLVAAVGIVVALAAGRPTASPGPAHAPRSHHPSAPPTRHTSPTPGASDAGNGAQQPSPRPATSSAPASSPATPSPPASPTSSSSPSPSASATSPPPSSSPPPTSPPPSSPPPTTSPPPQGPQAGPQTASATT